MITGFIERWSWFNKKKHNNQDLNMNDDESNSNLFIQKDIEENQEFVDVISDIKAFIKNYPIEDQFYLIDRPLIDKKYTYDYQWKSLVLLSTNYKILCIDLWKNVHNSFDDYVDDFWEDIWSIVSEYNFIKTVWRTRTLNQSDFIVKIKKEELEGSFKGYNIEDSKIRRKLRIMVSLLIGSINDAERIGSEVPVTPLAKIKQNIKLFDSEQIRFIYNTGNNKVVKIQWLAWTWKTELLLHKLREIYIKEEKNKIFFTCHNKTLASELRKRIPTFFDFMQVKKQIDWHNRLWVSHAWWSSQDSNSGLYAYLCDFYDIPFLRYYHNMTYEDIFNELLQSLNSKKDNEWNAFEYAFDYILIDESQDFPDVFFKVCEMVTKNKIYIAWDIFKSIFDIWIDNNATEVDFVLNKCYRTDPKTLMFAHAIWMWLFEEQKINFLEDDEWERCGYIIDKKTNDTDLILKREPMRRFDNIDNLRPINIEYSLETEEKVLSIIDKLRKTYSDLRPEDISIIFLDNNYKDVSKNIASLKYLLEEKFWYTANNAIETKRTEENTVFITNANNVKWLEFPFVICITNSINSDKQARNRLYTMLTRSFLESYLIINQQNELSIENEKWLHDYIMNWFIKTTRLKPEQIQKIRTRIKAKENLNLEDCLEGVFKELKISKDKQEKIKKLVTQTFFDKPFDKDIISKFVHEFEKYV